MTEEEIVDVCSKCGRMWDINGCQISGNGPYEIDEFVCEDCLMPATEEEDE